MSVALIAIGSEFRRDDGAALAVADALSAAPDLPVDRIVRCDGEPTRVIDGWDGAELAVVVDAVHAHPAEPGLIHEFRLRPDRDLVPGVSAAPVVGWAVDGDASTHGLGLGEAAALGAALERMPGRLVVIGIEGADFGRGLGLSPQVAEAVPRAVQRILRILTDQARCGEVRDP